MPHTCKCMFHFNRVKYMRKYNFTK